MPCFGLCISHRHNHHRFFYWPNFTFSHSQDKLDHHHQHRYRRPKQLFRRHSLPNGTDVSKLPNKPKKCKKSLASVKTVMTTGYAPPPGPPPKYRPNGELSVHERREDGRHVAFAPGARRSSELASNNPFRAAHMTGSQGQHPSEHPPDYEAPPGSPPNWNEEKRPEQDEAFAPPPGPPPAKQQQHDEPEPPPYEPWLQVQDNALLPPPPSIRNEASPTANASFDDAARAHAWCRQHSIWPPRRPNRQTISRLQHGDIGGLSIPPNTRTVSLGRTGTGNCKVKSTPQCADTILLSTLPLFTAMTASPAQTGKPKTIYYELRILSLGTPNSYSTAEVEAGIAIGFLAPPYPSWRLPGWHRASLAVHGDDGRRYVDNSYGGTDFVNAFAVGDVVGIGMTFSPARYGGKLGVEVFFTRNGRREGGWDMHEERDREVQEGDVLGLEGDYDLFAAVGVFGACDFEMRFRPDEWLWKG